MKLTLTQFLSLDGVSQGPGSPEEDTSDGFTQGGWMVAYIEPMFIRWAAEWLGEADALLFGRRTYAAFARDWPQNTDPNDPFAALMNGLPKYCASQSLRVGTWASTTILSGDVAARVSELKKTPGRELQIHGSARFAQSMLAAGLIDEVRLVIAPVIVGQGRRLFPDGGTPAGLRLANHDVTPAGLTLQVYEPVGQPRFGTYAGVSHLG